MPLRVLGKAGSPVPSTPEVRAAEVAAGIFVASLLYCAPWPCWM
jgi:hypothetical protein